MIYADSSFLVSLYLRDANAAAAQKEMKTHPQEIALSRIAALEVRNAFRLAVFREWIDSEQEKRLQILFDLDLKDNFLRPIPFSSDEIFAHAEQLSMRYTAISGNRSLDLLHIACARLAELNGFASFDRRQRKLANDVGMRVVPAQLENE